MFNKWKQTPPVSHPSKTITALTGLAFLVGFSSYFSLVMSICLYLPIMLYPFRKRINHQTPIEIGQCTISTYIMGIVDMYALTNPSLLSIFIWMTTIRYYGQFQLNNCFHHSKLKWRDFTIYHSPQYTIAFLFVFIEHVITLYYFDFSFKHYHPLVIPSFIISSLGLAIRIMAFFTAKNNFTHLVASRKKNNHQLVTHGVYKYLRHPSYTGFFYFSVFSMVMIGNFISAVGFGLGLAKFFRERIEDEEESLFEFFPEYKQYYKRTYTLLPYLVPFED